MTRDCTQFVHAGGQVQVESDGSTVTISSYQHIGAALNDIVRQEFNALSAHKTQERILPLFKLGLSKFEFHRCQLSLENPDQKIAAPAGRFQEPRVDTLAFLFDKVEHRLYRPYRSEYFPMVGIRCFDLVRLI